MIASHKKSKYDFLNHIKVYFIPNKNDNLKQLILKLFYILALISAFAMTFFFTGKFIIESSNKSSVEKIQNIWSSFNDSSKKYPESRELAINMLSEKNNDFKGWITIPKTDINCPIYQTDNNNFYINHDLYKKKSKLGAAFFDKNNIITKNKTDTNLVIYGNNTVNGSVFSNLESLRSLETFKKCYAITLSTLYDTAKYKIYALFILNSKMEDDGGNIYNIYRQDFKNSTDFNNWIKEAKQRSLINTNVNVKYGDNILTLVTHSDEFENARFVVMARRFRDGEQYESDKTNITINPSPKYPLKWYQERNIKQTEI